MELEGFATGFNNPPRQPGFSLENEEFVISFSGVMCYEAKRIVSHWFEVFYDWTEVMKLVLNATKNNSDVTDIEECAVDFLREWLTSFQGWGLLSSLLPTERHRHFILALAYTSANWDERTGGPHSPEKIFDTVKFVYDNIKGKELRTLVPSLGIWFEELSIDPEVSFKGENERKKHLVIFIKAKWTLEVKFCLEKKRVNMNLVDWAAERVTKDILHEEQLGELEQMPAVFPVESDRSHVNFFNVSLGGGGEEQVLTLRNATPEPVSLTLIIRESEEFLIGGPSGPVSTSQCLLGPSSTKDISVVFCPRKPGSVRGKLVLKPQGRKLGGKSFKATISLLGVPGHADIKMSGEHLVQLKQPACCQLVCSQTPTTRRVRFNNQGEAAGFVKIVASDETEGRLEVSPVEFVLGPGQGREVVVTVCMELQNQIVLSVFTGQELCRQVMNRARSIPGAARLGDNPALLGVDFSRQIPGEQYEQVPSQLTALDVLHFYQKTVKTFVSVTPLGQGVKQADFEGLPIEETLSETRIDQSIALPLFSTHQVVTKTRALVHSPPSKEEGDQLVLQPRHLSLARGCEGVVKLINRQARTVHWDLAWPAQHLDISPASGPLGPGGEVVLCLTALPSPALPGAWRGQVSIYSDDEVVTLDVTITPAPLTSPPGGLLVSSRRVDLGSAVLGGTNTGAIRVTNSGQLLIQWKAVVEPSFFSLPQPGGLLNPGQAISLAIHFKPAAPGPHNSSFSLYCAPVRGGQEPSASSAPLVVTLTGKAVSVKEAASLLPSGPKVAATKAFVSTTGGKKSCNSGTVSLETDLIVFKDTQLGENSVAKVKIKNRCGNDQTVEIIPLESQTPEGPQFKTVHSVIEVKNQCFCTVPVQFRPTFRGVHNQLISFRWEGSKIITATLRGNCV